MYIYKNMNNNIKNPFWDQDNRQCVATTTPFVSYNNLYVLLDVYRMIVFVFLFLVILTIYPICLTIYPETNSCTDHNRHTFRLQNCHSNGTRYSRDSGWFDVPDTIACCIRRTSNPLCPCNPTACTRAWFSLALPHSSPPRVRGSEHVLHIWPNKQASNMPRTTFPRCAPLWHHKMHNDPTFCFCLFIQTVHI